MKKSSNYKIINHYFVESKKYTFSVKVIREYLDKFINKDLKILNLFSGKSLIGIERIDLDTNESTKKMDVLEYLKSTNKLFDLILIDPPFSKELFKKYGKEFNGNYALWLTNIKREAARHLKLDGEIIIFGYSAQGFPANWGFENIELNIYTNGAERPSYFSCRAKKIENNKENFKWRNK